MARENTDLRLDEDETEGSFIGENDADDDIVPGSHDENIASSESRDPPDNDLLLMTEQLSLQPTTNGSPDPIPVVNTRGSSSPLTSPDSGKPSLPETAPETSARTPTKREIRRAKEAARKTHETGATSNTIERCNVCDEEFPSRTKLFTHINQTGHALAKEFGTKPISEKNNPRHKGKKGGRIEDHVEGDTRGKKKAGKVR